MESEEESFAAEENRRSPSKKKKKRKSKSTEEEEPEEPEIIIAETDIVEESSPTKKKKKKKSKDRPMEETASELEEVAPAPSSAFQALVSKKEPKTSIKSDEVPASAPTAIEKRGFRRRIKPFPILEEPVPSTPGDMNGTETEEKIQWDGMQILAKMAQDDIEELLRRVGLQCPINDTARHKARELKIHWGDVSFGCYGPMQCKSVWSFLRNHARTYRIMHEIVDEVKFNFKADYRKFMQKVIESSPDYPKQSYYGMGGFQYYCRELWDGYKTIQCKMNANVGNFLTFQTKCYNDWQQLSEETRNEYTKKGKLIFADYKRRVKEYYAKYPGFVPRVEKLDKDGKAERGVLTKAHKREALKMSNELYKDAPRLPLTPMQLFVNYKMNHIHPPPTEDYIPDLKAQLVDKWRVLSETKKLRWIKSCIKKSEHYVEELKEYRKTHPMYLLPKEFKISRLIKTEEVNLWFKANGEPPKPAVTTFDVLLTEFRVDNTGKSEEEIRKLAMAKWEELDWYHKELYKLKFAQQKVTFMKDFEDYFGKLPYVLRASAVGRLPKKFKKPFQDEVDKLPLVLENEEPTAITTSNEQETGIDEPTDRKRKHSVSAAEESSQGEEVEGGGSSPKKKKKKKRKKYEEDGEDKLDEVHPQSSSNAPLYMLELTDEEKKLLTEKVKENRALKADTKKKDVDPDIPDVKVDTNKNKKSSSQDGCFPGAPITQSKKKR